MPLLEPGVVVAVKWLLAEQLVAAGTTVAWYVLQLAELFLWLAVYGTGVRLCKAGWGSAISLKPVNSAAEDTFVKESVS